MKIIKFISLLIVAAVTSCSTDSDEIIPLDETEGLVKLQTIENDTHLAELYSKNGDFQEGFNKISVRLKDKSTKEFVQKMGIGWNPMMHMESMQHSAPASGVSKVAGKETLYEGYIIFQMPGNELEYWNLTFNYTVDGTEYSMESRINVLTSEKRRISVFSGTESNKYIMALVEPTEPKVAPNDIIVGLFKMENKLIFPVVDNYRILIDPRMPGMGNHSSPNNVPLTQMDAGGFYKGKLNLTMSGYWKINLQLENSVGEVVKGEVVSDTNESSSIFFELEF